jgi:hypothetical protein
MCLRGWTLKAPAKSSVPPGLPVYKCRPLPTPSKSTLLEVLIPLHFNSPRINTYKNPGRGPILPPPKFCNSLLPAPRLCSLATRHSQLAAVPVTPFPVTLPDHSQLTENPAALSPLPGTLTSHVKPKSFGCHSYKKHGGWDTPLNRKSPLQCRLLNCQLSTANLLLLLCPPNPGAIHA